MARGGSPSSDEGRAAASGPSPPLTRLTERSAVADQFNPEPVRPGRGQPRGAPFGLAPDFGTCLMAEASEAHGASLPCTGLVGTARTACSDPDLASGASQGGAGPPAPAGTAMDAVRMPAGNSAMARHRRPLRGAELAAVIVRGELQDGPGVAVAGPRCAARYPAGLPGRAARVSVRHGYPHFHSPARSHLYREVTSVFTDIIHRLMHRLLRWQGKRAAGEREAGEKAVISRCALPRGGQEVSFARIACQPGRSRPGVRSTRPGPYVGQALRRNPDMPSIPAAGPAQAPIVVTVSLRPGAARRDPGQPRRPARRHPARDRGPRRPERGRLARRVAGRSWPRPGIGAWPGCGARG